MKYLNVWFLQILNLTLFYWSPSQFCKSQGKNKKQQQTAFEKKKIEKKENSAEKRSKEQREEKKMGI